MSGGSGWKRGGGEESPGGREMRAGKIRKAMAWGGGGGQRGAARAESGGRGVPEGGRGGREGPGSGMGRERPRPMRRIHAAGTGRRRWEAPAALGPARGILAPYGRRCRPRAGGEPRLPSAPPGEPPLPAAGGAVVSLIFNTSFPTQPPRLLVFWEILFKIILGKISCHRVSKGEQSCSLKGGRCKNYWGNLKQLHFPLIHRVNRMAFFYLVTAVFIHNYLPLHFFYNKLILMLILTISVT